MYAIQVIIIPKERDILQPALPRVVCLLGFSSYLLYFVYVFSICDFRKLTGVIAAKVRALFRYLSSVKNSNFTSCRFRASFFLLQRQNDLRLSLFLDKRIDCFGDTRNFWRSTFFKDMSKRYVLHPFVYFLHAILFYACFLIISLGLHKTKF